MFPRAFVKKKHDPPPVQDRPPAMFVGDEEPPPQSISAQALVAGAPAAALLPEDLRVTVEGTSGDRVPLMVFALLAVLFGGLGVVKGLELSVFSIIMAGLYAFIAATCASIAWTERRVLMRGRKEYRLEADGIVMSVLYGGDPTLDASAGRRSWTTR